MDLNTLPTFVNSCRTVLIESQQLDSGVEKIKTKQNKNSMPFSFIKIFSPHSHLFQVLEMSEQENWFCFSEPFLTCRKNRERGCFLFFGLKLFLWNGKKSHKRYRINWGTVGSRSCQVAMRNKHHRPWSPSSCCLKAVWGSPKKFSLFCCFWENLEHKFTKKMDVWITSFKQT